MLQASTQAVGDLVAAVTKDHHLERPVLVAVGGGAGALGRAVASAMGLEIIVPPSAEVISAIGDALSLVRTERERTFDHPTPADTQRLIADVEAEAMRAGAAASTLDVRVEHITERSAVRVTVTGAVGLSSGAMPGRRRATDTEAAAAAEGRGFSGVAALGQYWVASRSDDGGRVAVFDQYADLVIDVRGDRLSLDGPDSDRLVAAALARNTRRVGPVTIAPDAWVISGARLLQVPDPEPSTIIDTAAAISSDGPVPTVIIGRE
jgi:hypothetical protein